jgi:hypothetical protein
MNSFELNFVKYSHLMTKLCYIITFTALISATSAVALSSPRVSVLVGPPAYGAGDPNPVTFQNPIEYEFQTLIFENYEIRASGLGAFVGYRATTSSRSYVSAGLGISFTVPGVGGSLYFGVGHDLFCLWICATADIFNALGVGKLGYITGLYRFQFGVSKNF